MMRPIQRKHPFPYGDALCVPLDDVVIFRQTSGDHRATVSSLNVADWNGGVNPGPTSYTLRVPEE